MPTHSNKPHWLYLTGFFIILALPVLALPPYFFPPDWGKTIIFRSILSILLFLLIYQIISKKTFSHSAECENVKKNPIAWALIALFVTFLLATIFSVDINFSLWGSPLRGGGFINYAFYLIFSIAAFIFFKEKDWERGWIFSIFIGVLVSLLALIQFYGLFDKIFISLRDRPESTVGNPIFLGIYLLLLSFPSLSFAIKEQFNSPWGKIKKIFYLFSFLLFVYVILITESRAAYLGVVFGILSFFLFYPKKNKLLKIGFIFFLIFIFAVVLYVNLTPQVPNFLQNKIINNIVNRLSIKTISSEERFRAWQIVVKEIKDRPLLGWGPENLAAGFDKFYDPKIVWSPWWDRAHNVFLDIGAQAGILGVLSYLSLFIILFWQLHKIKNTKLLHPEYQNTQIIITGLQATLVSYLVANFFSFDCFSTYLIFFFIIAYILHLTPQGESKQQPAPQKIPSIKSYILNIISGMILIIFLWQYNFVPLQINANINTANFMAKQGKCEGALFLMEKNLPKRSFLDSFLRLRYVDNIRICSPYNREKNLEYTQKAFSALKEAVKFQPLFTRAWIYLGSFATILANNEQNPQIKNNLIEEARSYFEKAKKLSPLHTEIIIEEAKIDEAGGNYQKMLQRAENCLNINPNSGDCYWIKSLAEIYLGNLTAAEESQKLAEKWGFERHRSSALRQLLSAYTYAKEYKKLAQTYEELILKEPEVAQYHASLAFTYSIIGEYEKARKEAMEFLKLMPEAKEEVDRFLKTLPH